MSKRYTITAALPYTNGPIHIGHLAGVYVPADIYSRYLRLTGRTASEIKSTLGAQPRTLTCYCKHKYYLPNLILKPFIKNVKIKSFKQHQPFK
jgi:hypothetical protein